jgi:hypothetical protein
LVVLIRLGLFATENGRFLAQRKDALKCTPIEGFLDGVFWYKRAMSHKPLPLRKRFNRTLLDLVSPGKSQCAGTIPASYMRHRAPYPTNQEVLWGIRGLSTRGVYGSATRLTLSDHEISGPSFGFPPGANTFRMGPFTRDTDFKNLRPRGLWLRGKTRLIPLWCGLPNFKTASSQAV